MTPALPPGTLADVTVTVQNPDTLVSTLLGGWFADFTDVAGGDPVSRLRREAGPQRRDGRMRLGRLLPRRLRHARPDGGFPAQVQARVRARAAPVHGPGLRRRAVHRRAVRPVDRRAREPAGHGRLPVRAGRALLPRQHGQPAADGGLPPQGAPRLGPRAARVHRTVFDDVPCTGGPFDPWIEELASLGVTGGCQSVPVPLYCPTNPNTRGQMAVFLVKAFTLP